MILAYSKIQPTTLKWIVSNMGTVDRLEIFPIKSLDGCPVNQATITSGGALEFDRRWALVDAQGNFVNAKRYAKIHTIRSNFDLATFQLALSAPGMPNICAAIDDPALSDWFSRFFDRLIQITENTIVGFPDDTESPGPTIISTATLQEIASWYLNLSVTEIRRRLRTNIEITGVPAFWEDRLFTNSPQDFSIAFGATCDSFARMHSGTCLAGRGAIGNIPLQGINPCQRCVVPTRNATTGSVDSGFQKTFGDRRAATLPAEIDRSRFNHFYRVAVNTRLPASAIGHTIQIGDSIRLV
jgi:uncharacterized protein